MDSTSIAPKQFYLIYRSRKDPEPISPSDYKDSMQAYGKREEGSGNFLPSHMWKAMVG